MSMSRPRAASAWFGLFVWLAPITCALAASGAGVVPAGSLAPMLDRALPGVVSIIVTAAPDESSFPPLNAPFFRQFFDLPQTQDNPDAGYGSGVIIDAARGLVLTNAHVVEQVATITLRLNDGREADATVLGSDIATDIAVLQVRLDGLTAIPVGRSAGLRVGDQVVAIGDAFGLDQTVTTGIVSALGRNDLGIEDYEDFIQVDANISPGNSGGPLLDVQGRLVGINTAILEADSGGGGIGFAIPADMAMLVAHELIAHGKMNHGAIGASLQDLTPQLAAVLNTMGHHGVLITAILPGTPAETIGLRPGDLLTSVDGVAVTTAAALHNVVGMSLAGSRLRLGLLRDGKSLALDVVLEPRDGMVFRHLGGPDQQDATAVPHLDGATFSNAPAHGAMPAGVQIDSLDPGGPADQGGLVEGDVIVSVNGVSTPDTAALAQEMSATDTPQVLRIYRQDQALFVVVW